MIARSPAAPRTTASRAFAAAEPTRVSDLAEWLADTSDGLSAGARLGLRIEAVASPPMAGDEEDNPGAVEADPAESYEGQGGPAGVDGAAPEFRLVLQLRSNADPSLIVDAAALWSQPETVLARFGSQAETDLLLALRRGAAIWPPLAEVLGQASPSVIGLDDDALTSLLGPTAEVAAEDPLADLADQVTGIVSAPVPLKPPAGLAATLRPYQQRGLTWPGRDVRYRAQWLPRR